VFGGVFGVFVFFGGTFVVVVVVVRRRALVVVAHERRGDEHGALRDAGGVGDSPRDDGRNENFAVADDVQP
jgi:hypothetical protein